MEQYDALRMAVGRADACELLSQAFAFPGEELARGLVEGAVADDARSCLADMGVADDAVDAATSGLRAWSGASVADVLADMRKAYPHLYFTPGGHTPIFPYESAFLHVVSGAEGAPVLFRTPITLDVERSMLDAGVAAKNSRKEPCDSVQEEFEFLSYLFAEQAEAVRVGDEAALARRAQQIQAFLRGHALVWLPQFMDRTCALVDGPYAALASYASVVLTHLSSEE